MAGTFEPFNRDVPGYRQIHNDKKYAMDVMPARGRLSSLSVIGAMMARHSFKILHPADTRPLDVCVAANMTVPSGIRTPPCHELLNPVRLQGAPGVDSQETVLKSLQEPHVGDVNLFGRPVS